jgi:hypothetical protein
MEVYTFVLYFESFWDKARYGKKHPPQGPANSDNQIKRVLNNNSKWRNILYVFQCNVHNTFPAIGRLQNLSQEQKQPAFLELLL